MVLADYFYHYRMRVKQLGAYTYPTLFAALVAISGLVDGADGLIVWFAFLTVIYWFQQRWALWVGLIASLYMISFHATWYSLSDAELEHLKLGKKLLGAGRSGDFRLRHRWNYSRFHTALNKKIQGTGLMLDPPRTLPKASRSPGA